MLGPLETPKGDTMTEPTEAVDQQEQVDTSTIDWKKYKIPHRFVGFDPKQMDLERLPRSRKDVDGTPGRRLWHGLDCVKCGLQVRREKRTNREASLNVYAHESVPTDMLRSCTEEKRYPLLWRSRDPFLALDILGVDD